MTSDEDGHRPLRKNADYLNLTVGESISNFGSASASFAFPLILYTETRSAAQTSIVMAASVGGNLLGALVVGGWVDQRSRKSAMIISLCGRLVIWTGIAAMIHAGRLLLPFIVIGAFLSGVLGALYQAAEAGALKSLIDPEQFPTAISVLEGRQASSSLAGAPVGALLLRLSAATPFWFNAASYAVSLLGVLRIKTPLGHPTAQSAQSMWKAAIGGFRYIWVRNGFRPMLLSASFVNFGTNAFTLALIIILRRHGQPTWAIALVQTAIGLSLLIGSLLAGRLIRRCSLGFLIIGSPLLRFLALLTTSLFSDRIAVFVIAMSFAYLFAPASNSAWMSYIAISTPNDLQGRVAGAEEFSSSALIPVATFAAGLAVSEFTDLRALGLFAGVVFISVVTLLCSPAVRRLPRLAQLESA